MTSPRTAKRAKEEELPRFSSSIRVLRSVEKRVRVKTANEDQTVNAVASKLEKALGRPGVARAALFASEATPVFQAHPKDPDLLIRSFKSGKQESGRIDARGVFRLTSPDKRK